MDCGDIIEKYLKDHGFDGLHDGARCSCDLEDLFWCGKRCSECVPGYKVVPPEDSQCNFDFYICPNRDDRPWEDGA